MLALALAVRLWGLGFGLPFANARPDETGIAGPAVHFLSGDLRPPHFMYPTFFMYAVALLYLAYAVLGRPFTGYTTLDAFAESRRQSLAPFFYLSRGLSAVMGTLTVWWVYELARLVFDDTVGSVAALFLALSVLHVRDSHFGVTDVTMTALIVLTVLQIVRWQRTGDPRRAAVAGLIGGLATSTKYNGLGVWAPFAVAAILRVLDARPAAGRELRRSAIAVAIFGVAFVVFFLAASPYIVLEWDRFVRDVTAQGTTFSVGHGMAVGRGWWHHARVTLPAALGWPVYLGGLAGVAGLLASKFRQAAVILAFPLAYYLVAGSGQTVFARYAIPLLPFLCITAAWLVVSAVGAVTASSSPGMRRAIVAAAALAMVAPSARDVVLLDRLLTRADNRVVAANALATVIPPGSRVYQTGDSAGHVAFALEPQLRLNESGYDEATGQFTRDGRPPDWIIVQRSPLILYSRVPEGVERIVRERYDLVRALPVEIGGGVRIYDQQDALFLPLQGLDGVERIGPSFDVYRLRGGARSGGS